MINKSHPLANFLKVSASIYATTLQRVKEDSQAKAKIDPSFSGVPPETNHWFWNEQLPKLCFDEFYRKQVEAEVKELDMKAANIERAMQNQMQVWETEKGSLEMKSEKLKQILLESKKKLQL